MTEAEKERAAVVACLKSSGPSQPQWGVRLFLLWYALTDPVRLVRMVHWQCGQAIERGDHLAEKGGEDAT